MRTKHLILAALFAALTAIGAFIRIPAGLTYMTLQLFFTWMAGLLLGPKWGAASQAAYVLLGLLGLPIFTEGGGLFYVLKPSFGFLLGLPVMAYITGRLANGACSGKRMLLACVVSLAALYLIGLPYLYVVCNAYLGMGISVWTAVKTGMLIYLPGDALKIAAAVVLAKRLVPRLRPAG